mmetsp:Transcript_54380/g.129594  ORF Transcript_54380/g.129594 Transcript_54380/m.129594 type:complete len:241 (-) Transcript_54380:337-1059(-)|eukprot:CAMPEP_0178409294 /NCGR_PEP_ID=MMETSP0689_2-20121128/20389_1 /TAXON_ID=160604 /ORGANISM="Amphidinium massartii, Strain CS-259" /LENGTH=240 /DNA_ID=CAMNT_0020030433 /DNA_START=31 /DNA_END=753 /DNA_ORIENTATION=-
MASHRRVRPTVYLVALFFLWCGASLRGSATDQWLFVSGPRSTGSQRRIAQVRESRIHRQAEAPKSPLPEEESAELEEPRKKKEKTVADKPAENEFSLFKEWTWLNPARSFERRRVLEAAAEAGQRTALTLTLITLLTKAGMLLRTSLGLSPVEDSYWVELSGRLVPIVSGVLLPFAQVSALFLAAIAVATFLMEELQKDNLRLLNVDVDKQQRLRATTAALLVMCVILQASPPLPDDVAF